MPRERTGRPRGRPKGSKSKIPHEIRELARSYAPEALEMLWRLARRNTTPEAARVAAIKELLDRGLGKSRQAIGGDEEGEPITIQVVRRTIVDPKKGSRTDENK